MKEYFGHYEPTVMFKFVEVGIKLTNTISRIGQISC
jgi:hypothetical protein